MLVLNFQMKVSPINRPGGPLRVLLLAIFPRSTDLMVRQEYFIVLSIYFFFFCPGFGRLPLMVRGGDVLVATGGFGRIGLAGGDTLRANSLRRLAWMPFLGITYRSVRLMDDEDGFSTSLEVVGGTGPSAGVVTPGAVYHPKNSVFSNIIFICI